MLRERNELQPTHDDDESCVFEAVDNDCPADLDGDGAVATADLLGILDGIRKHLRISRNHLDFVKAGPLPGFLFFSTTKNI